MRYRCSRQMTLQSRCVLLMAVVLCALTVGACSPAPVNYAAAGAGATITGPTNASGHQGQPNCAIDGEVADYGLSHGYAWAHLDTPTIVAFAEAALIDTVEVITLDTPSHAYRYRVSVSLDGQQWQQVADVSTMPMSGWQIHRFDPLEASYLKLDFTHSSSASGSYHLVEVGASHLGSRQAGPLGRQWTERRAARARLHIELLGVPHAQAALEDPELLRLLRRAPQKQAISHRLADGSPTEVYRDGTATVMVLHDGAESSRADDAGTGVNDCLAIDSDGDGLLDRTIDYKDVTGDGLADTMVQTYLHGSTWGDRPFMVLIRALHSHPLRLWYLHNYGYWQRQCQWHCDFAGNGYFAMFRRDQAQGRWVATWESPFCFYDHDDDGFPEETVRIRADDTMLHSARYSINVSNHRPLGQLYGYDVGITCLGQVSAPADALTSFTHRSGEQTGGFLAWERTREVVREAQWSRALLIWNENGHNVAATDPGRERWEGIINSKYRQFPQEGGPACGTVNKRYELDGNFSGRMQLYYWQGDGRLHLYGADHGTLEVDYNYDGRLDMVVEYQDTTSDGFFDRRTVDYADPDLPRRRIHGPAIYRPPHIARERPSESALITYSYPELAGFWPDVLEVRIAEGKAVLELLVQLSRIPGLSVAATPLEYFHRGTGEGRADMDQLRASAQALRYYQDVAIELMLAHMIVAAQRDDAQQRVERLQQAQRHWDTGRLAYTALALRELLRECKSSEPR